MTGKPTLGLKQSQRLQLTPSVRFALDLLRLPLAEFHEAIQKELADNPYLELAGASPLRPPGRRPAMDYAEVSIAAPPAPAEAIRSQIAIMELDPDIHEIAEFLIGNLDDHGYLDTSVAEVVQLLDVETGRVQQALDALQSCDPPGVGARDLQECLLLQLLDADVPPADAQLLVGQLEPISRGDWAGVAKATGTPEARIRDLAAMLRNLSPYPIEIGQNDALFLIPDVLVEQTPDGRFETSLFAHAAPDIRFDRELSAQARTGGRAQLEEKKGRARALVGAVRFRNDTLLTVVREIVRHQDKALRSDLTMMRPLTRSDLAATLDIHPSTVGRVIHGKALEFNGEVIPLERFLSTALNSRGGPVSAFAVQQRIRRMIDAEKSDAILSDEAISLALRADGVDIARRTVAKYRGCLNIPSSSRRRQKKAKFRSHMKPSSSIERNGSPHKH